MSRPGVVFSLTVGQGICAVTSLAIFSHGMLELLLPISRSESWIQWLTGRVQGIVNSYSSNLHVPGEFIAALVASSLSVILLSCKEILWRASTGTYIPTIVYTRAKINSNQIVFDIRNRRHFLFSPHCKLCLPCSSYHKIEKLRSRRMCRDKSRSSYQRIRIYGLGSDGYTMGNRDFEGKSNG